MEMLGQIIGGFLMIFVVVLLGCALFLCWRSERKVRVISIPDDEEFLWMFLLDDEGECDG